MAVVSAYPLLKRPGVRSFLQHFHIMITLEKQRITGAILFSDIGCDVTKVRQALFNLLSNAAKFTHEGTITLAVSAETDKGVPWVNMAVTEAY